MRRFLLFGMILVMGLGVNAMNVPNVPRLQDMQADAGLSAMQHKTSHVPPMQLQLPSGIDVSKPNLLKQPEVVSMARRTAASSQYFTISSGKAVNYAMYNYYYGDGFDNVWRLSFEDASGNQMVMQFTRFYYYIEGVYHNVPALYITTSGDSTLLSGDLTIDFIQAATDQTSPKYNFSASLYDDAGNAYILAGQYAFPKDNVQDYLFAAMCDYGGEYAEYCDYKTITLMDKVVEPIGQVDYTITEPATKTYYSNHGAWYVYAQDANLGASFFVYADQLAGNFTKSDIDYQWTNVYFFDTDTTAISLYKPVSVSVTETANATQYVLSVITFDSVQLNITMNYPKIVAKETVTSAIYGVVNHYYDEGAIVLQGVSDDDKIQYVTALYSNDVLGQYTHKDTYYGGKFDYIIYKDTLLYVADNYSLTITEGTEELEGYLVAEISFLGYVSDDRSDAIQFNLMLYAEYRDPYYPSDKWLSQYYTQGQLCVCCYFGNAEVCNDIVFAGTYNGWSTDLDYMARFQKVEGYEGWWVVAVDDYSTAIQGKPIQLKSDGTFSWEYQCNDQVEVVRGGATIQPGFAGEVNITYTDLSAPILLYVPGWKNGNSPCVTVPKHNYTIQLKAPVCANAEGEYYLPAIIGGFNNWEEGILMSYNYTSSYYEYTLQDVEEGTEFKFRASSDEDWSNQIQLFDAETNMWYDNPNLKCPESEGDATLTVDYSEGRYTLCVDDTITYTIAVTVPDFCADVAKYADSVQVIGDFDGWTGTWMEKVPDEVNTYYAEIQAVAGSEIKFRAGTSWDMEIVYGDGELLSNFNLPKDNTSPWYNYTTYPSFHWIGCPYSFRVALSSSNDNVGVVQGSGDYEPYSQILITATPIAEGYHFVAWSDGSTIPGRYITVESDIELTAAFEMDEPTSCLDVSVNSVVMGEADIQMVATPYEGYYFISWQDGNTDNPRIVTSESGSFVAIFNGQTAVKERMVDANNNRPMYDVLGRQVGKNVPGVMVMKGEKILINR